MTGIEARDLIVDYLKPFIHSGTNPSQSHLVLSWELATDLLKLADAGSDTFIHGLNALSKNGLFGFTLIINFEQDGHLVTLVTGYSDAEKELLNKCLEIIRQERRASTAIIQRSLRLESKQAVRLAGLLEEHGLIGPAYSDGERQILFDVHADSLPRF